MGEHSFKLESDDNEMLNRQMNLIRNLANQRDQIVAQLQHEIDFCNAIFRAAALAAKVADDELREVDVPLIMIGSDGMVMAKVRNGIVTWTLPDEGEGEVKQDEESEDG